MSKYRITLEGKVYEMEISLVEKTTTASKMDTVSRKADLHFTNNSTNETDKTSKDQSGIVKSPMPGTIIEVFKREGDTVLKGDTVLILEAMKMENEILAPKEGRIVKSDLCVGTSVSTDDILFVIG